MTPRSWSVWRTAKWLAGCAIALLLVSIFAGNVFGQYVMGRARQQLPPPGRLIAVDGHRLHMLCTGQGRPVVLLESGSGAWSTHWALVQPKVASLTRVCSYDRAGLGWSEPGPKPQDIQRNVRDLEALLAHSGEEGPFVFAGWSFGGSIVWLHAQNHLDQIAGLVMVDARPGGWQTRLNKFAPELSTVRVGFATRLRRIQSVGLGPVYSWYLLHAGGGDSIRGFPEGTGDVLLDPGLQAGMFEAMIDAVDADDISERQMAMRSLGNVPLIVIRHGREGMFGLAPVREQIAEARWRAAQKELAQMSTDARLEVAATSGHGIPLEEPDVIVDAIEELVKKWRARH